MHTADGDERADTDPLRSTKAGAELGLSQAAIVAEGAWSTSTGVTGGGGLEAGWLGRGAAASSADPPEPEPPPP